MKGSRPRIDAQNIILPRVRLHTMSSLFVCLLESSNRPIKPSHKDCVISQDSKFADGAHSPGNPLRHDVIPISTEPTTPLPLRTRTTSNGEAGGLLSLSSNHWTYSLRADTSHSNLEACTRELVVSTYCKSVRKMSSWGIHPWHPESAPDCVSEPRTASI